MPKYELIIDIIEGNQSVYRWKDNFKKSVYIKHPSRVAHDIADHVNGVNGVNNIGTIEDELMALPGLYRVGSRLDISDVIWSLFCRICLRKGGLTKFIDVNVDNKSAKLALPKRLRKKFNRAFQIIEQRYDIPNPTVTSNVSKTFSELMNGIYIFKWYINVGYEKHIKRFPNTVKCATLRDKIRNICRDEIFVKSRLGQIVGSDDLVDVDSKVEKVELFVSDNTIQLIKTYKSGVRIKVYS